MSEVQTSGSTGDTRPAAAGWRFCGWQFEAHSGDLRWHGHGAGGPAATAQAPLSSLPPQPALLLATLLQRAGEAVARQKIYEVLWGERHVDAEHALNHCVRQLRRALGDDARDPRMIETLRGRGYRFVAPVEVIAAAEPVDPVPGPAETSASAVPSDAGVVSTAPASPAPPRRGALGAGLAAAALALMLLSLRGSPALSAPHTDAPPSAAARDAYVAGSYLASTSDPADWSRASAELRRAVDLDPEHAGAWLAMARLQVKLGQTGRRGPIEAFTTARHAADRALALSSGEPAALLTRGLAELYLTLDWASAGEHLRRAAEADPASPATGLWHARALAGAGRFDAAAAEARRVVDLDPSYTPALFDLGWFHYFAGRYDEAAATCRRVLELQPGSFTAWQCLAVAEWRRGHPEAAARAARHGGESLGLPGTAPGRPGMGVAAGDADRSPADTLRRVADLLGTCPTRSLALQRAQLLALVGDRQGALAELEDGVDRRLFWAPFVALDPSFAELRSEARFTALVGAPPGGTAAPTG